MKRIQVCFLFVYLEFIVPLENISLIWRSNPCRWRAANFDLCSVLMAIEQWGFVNVPHPLRHGPTVYNGHLRGPVTLTPVPERLAVELSLPVFTTNVCRDRGSNPISLMQGERSASTPPRLGFKFVQMENQWIFIKLIMVFFLYDLSICVHWFERFVSSERCGPWTSCNAWWLLLNRRNTVNRLDSITPFPLVCYI
mgnify:CR=1 FL=1